MDDLSSKISQILSDPQAMEQIKGLGEQLGITNTSDAFVNNNNDKKESGISAFSSGGGFSPDMLSMMSKIAPLMQNVTKEDDTTRLLYALRPFLSDERRKKLDEASKLLKMMKLLPLIKDFGILDAVL